MVISNCVINLAADKGKVLAEAARVLRPGGRFAVSDVIASPDMDEATRADMEQWTGCIAGALTREEFEQRPPDAGLEDVEIRETHAVHECASSAIIRARKPGRDVGERVAQAEIQLNDPQTLYRRWEAEQWSPFDDRPRPPIASSGRAWTGPSATSSSSCSHR